MGAPSLSRWLAEMRHRNFQWTDDRNFGRPQPAEPTVNPMIGLSEQREICDERNRILRRVKQISGQSG